MSAPAAPLHASAQSWTFSGVPAGAEGLVLAELAAGRLKLGDAPQTLLHIAVNDRVLDQLSATLAFFAPGAEIITFPAWDCMPYDRASPHAHLMAARMRALAALARPPGRGRARIILTTVNAALQKLPPRAALKNTVFDIRKGSRLNQAALVDYLASQGYRRSGKAMEPGEFAVRGGIIDLIPSGSDRGIRIDLFGDDIESLRSFDPLTQRTESETDAILLYPMSEVLLTSATVERFRERYRELFGAVHKDDPLYESISESRPYPGMEHWLPLFYETTDTLFDYCGAQLVTMDHETPVTVQERQETIRDYYESRATAGTSGKKNSFAAGAPYNPVPAERLFLSEPQWQARLSAAPSALFSPFTESGSPRTLPVGYRPALRFAQGQPDNTPFQQLKEAAGAAGARGRVTLIACYTDGSRERLHSLLMERGFHCLRIEDWQQIRELKGKTLGLMTLPLESGFESDRALMLSEQDVLGERIARARPRKRKSEVFLAESVNFAEGELVVHKEHGIGRFEGLVTLTVSGAAHDCLKIIYDGDDKLFLPVENIEMISRFGLEEEHMKLDKLGGAGWQARKAKLKQRIRIAAEALLKTAAQRLLRKAEIIETPTGTYEDFCSRFPYMETDDQARAIEEVLEDLHSGRPMDRLICGDVGFGKTEVALRAAFVAAMGGAQATQVAVIAPTTLLARQHYRNFRERFAGFPVEIRQLSRIVPAREQKETLALLAEGRVNIVIGTHALLSRQVQFRNLGLLIVDEEQHFGVGQKEKLKELKSGIHVLTLSATPIPRTLQMALTGVRDLSLITTPPVDRLAIRSFVMPFDPVVVKEAVQREMHRNGKCFLVTPRIRDIGDLKAQIADIVPEARMAVAHGQMPASELDRIMNEFYDGRYDILLSTAIIESGLDIPTANTMIIHNAHLFGLSQLYQMRGRVGRGKTRAYAYFMLPHRRELTRNATRRLEVMQTLDTLGAGFTLASHDMDIRGFGNLVGEEQSGHIREVGIELYQQMLEDTVARLRAGRGMEPAEEEAEWSPQINLGISVLIPEAYVGDLQLRLGLYRRVAGMMHEEDIHSFAAELTDRFGDMPQEVRQLIAVLGIKLLCKTSCIERIDAGPKGAVITFRDNTFPNPAALMEYVEKHIRNFKVRPDMKLVFSHDWSDDADKLARIRKTVADIASLAQGAEQSRKP